MAATNSEFKGIEFVNLTIDIGNTCVKLVAFTEGGEVAAEQRTDSGDTARLIDFCKQHDFRCGIYSTVSDLPAHYLEALHALPFPVMEFRSGVTPVPIANRYASPLTLGADRLAAAVGANLSSPGRDVLIIDVGTCVTFDFVSRQGEYLGGNISLGPTMRLRALHDYTARLPLVERRGEKPQLGTDTQTAIRCGVTDGIKYEIEGYIRCFLAKYPELLVVLTGGVHLDLQLSAEMPIFVDDFIVPRGLNRILEYNNERKK